MKNKVSVFSTNIGNKTQYGIEYSFDETHDSDTIMSLNKACDTYLFQSINRDGYRISPLEKVFEKVFDGEYSNTVQFSNPRSIRHRIIMRGISSNDVNNIACDLAALLGTECISAKFSSRENNAK